jgi:hypothetical protein
MSVLLVRMRRCMFVGGEQGISKSSPKRFASTFAHHSHPLRQRLARTLAL